MSRLRELAKWADTQDVPSLATQPTPEQILDAIHHLGEQVNTLSLRFDALLENLAEDEDPDPTTLDGLPLRERDQSEPL